VSLAGTVGGRGSFGSTSGGIAEAVGCVVEALESNGREVDMSLRLLSGLVVVDVFGSVAKGATLRKSFMVRFIGAACVGAGSARDARRDEDGLYVVPVELDGIGVVDEF